MNLAFFVEIALSLLLAATLVYCILLERRLKALRDSQDGLKQTIDELNSAIVAAGNSMRALKALAADAAETLDARTARARVAIDELSLLTASGERIAERIERGTPVKSAAIQASASNVPPPQAAMAQTPIAHPRPQTAATSAARNGLPSGSVMNRLQALRAAR